MLLRLVPSHVQGGWGALWLSGEGVETADSSSAAMNTSNPTRLIAENRKHASQVSTQKPDGLLPEQQVKSSQGNRLSKLCTG